MPGVFSALISNGTSTSRPLPAARAIELVTVGNTLIARRATPSAVANTEKSFFLFEKFIKCLVDYVLFVRIPVVEFRLAPRDPFGQSDRRSLFGIRNPHRFRYLHELREQLLGQVNRDCLAQFLCSNSRAQFFFLPIFAIPYSLSPLRASK